MNSVSQGKYLVNHKSHGSLETSGLATCSAISFMINETYNFMAHIDAKTNVDKIAENITLQFGKPMNISNVKIWYGDGISGYTSSITQKLIDKFTRLLDIDIYPKKEDTADIIKHNDIVECRKCGSRSGTLKIITHNHNCEYTFRVLIRKVGFMETVYS